MTLRDALAVTVDDVVAFVGGGGKTTAMFRLAREIVASGGRVITTTTTRIFAGQIALAPTHVLAREATPARVRAALAAHGHVLVVGGTDVQTGKADGVPLALFQRLREWCPRVALLNEADGSRMRPFKAPAGHEPVIPPETTIVVPVVGADVFGRPLDAEHVHRPEILSAIAGAPLGAVITPALVARVLLHGDGGRKGAPADARFVPLINKLDAPSAGEPARETARLLLREPSVSAVVLASVRADPPVVEVVRR